MIQQNVFGIETPEDYGCRIVSYTLSHSELVVEIRSPDGLIFFNVCFVAVDYFSGPMLWLGANFQVDERQNALDILRTLLPYQRASEDELAWLVDRRKLYVVSTTDHVVKILAAGGEVLKSEAS